MFDFTIHLGIADKDIKTRKKIQKTGRETRKANTLYYKYGEQIGDLQLLKTGGKKEGEGRLKFNQLSSVHVKLLTNALEHDLISYLPSPAVFSILLLHRSLILPLLL